MTTIFATVTVTVTAPAQAEAPEPTGFEAFGPGIYLLPPFPPTTGQTVASTLTIEPPSTDKVEFPYGPAPTSLMPEDALGTSTLPLIYAPGVAILLNTLAVVAIFRLCLGKKGSAESKRVNPKKPGVKEEAVIPLLTTWPWPQVLALAGLNYIAADLLKVIVLLNRATLPDGGAGVELGTVDLPSNWTVYAGKLGPPITMLTWGIIAGLVRAKISLGRLASTSLPFRTRFRDESLATFSQKALHTIFFRSLVIEGVGLAMPLAAMTILSFETWIWKDGKVDRDPKPRYIVSHFIPALYWNGTGQSLHWMLLAGNVLLGPALYTMEIFALVYYSVPDVLRHYFPGVVRLRNVSLTSILGILYCGGMLLCVVWMVVLFFHAMTGLGESFTAWFLENVVGLGCVVLLVPIAPLMLVFLAYAELMWLPLVAISYVLKAHIFRTVDVHRSGFFIPWTEWSAWDRYQAPLVLLSTGLGIYYTWRLRRSYK